MKPTTGDPLVKRLWPSENVAHHCTHHIQTRYSRGVGEPCPNFFNSSEDTFGDWRSGRFGSACVTSETREMGLARRELVDALGIDADDEALKIRLTGLLGSMHQRGLVQNGHQECCPVVHHGTWNGLPAEMKIGQAINGLDQRSMTPIIGTAPTRTESSELLADAEWLRREYVENHRTHRDIARELRECHHTTVVRALDRHGIPARPAGRRATQIDRALSVVADEFAGILDEMVAQLRADKERHAPRLDLIGHRLKTVADASRADESWAASRALVELASAALLCAEAKRSGKM